MKVVIKENTWLQRIGWVDFGWGNGYVLIPKDNHLHGTHYDDIDVVVHGGLTFSEIVDAEMVEAWGLDKDDEGKWCVGFDTAHYGDSLAKWTKEKVEEETQSLKEQLLSL